jgi:4-amino-4-deoxy-L-arabinose transferase-like glycosyltransferase
MSAHNTYATRSRSQVIPWLAHLCLVGVIVIAVVARFYWLRVTPGWYADEGSDIDIATHMMRGEQRYFAIGQSTLVAARLPLSHLALAALFRLFGRDILVLRTLTAACGCLVVILLYVLGRQIWGPDLALLAAALYAIYPQAVLTSRLGFLYNQIAVFNFLLFYALWRFVVGGSRWWLVAACLSASLSLLTNVSGLPTIGFIIIVLFFTRRPAIRWAVPLLAGLPMVYAAWMMAQAPQAFQYDAQYTFTRVGGSWLIRIAYAVWNYKQLLSCDAWFPLGAFGLTLLRPSRNRLYTLAFFWYNLFATVAGVPAVTGLGSHYVIPLLPWTAVGMAAFVMWAFPRLVAGLEGLYNRLYVRLPQVWARTRWRAVLWRWGRTWAVGLALFWVLVSPFVAMTVQDGLAPGYAPPEIAQVTVRSIRDAENAIAYVNRHIASDDVVLAPPHVAWMVNGQVADFQQAVAYTGGETQNYPSDLDRSRFLFDCSAQNATYAVLWDEWREWAGGEMPDVDEVFRMIESWPVVYERGKWQVFANPRYQADKAPALPLSAQLGPRSQRRTFR